MGMYFCSAITCELDFSIKRIHKLVSKNTIIFIRHLNSIILDNTLYKTVGYNMDSIQQFARLVVNPTTIYSDGSLFICTTADQASDLMTALA